MAYGSCLQSTGTGFTGSPDNAFRLVSGLAGPWRTTLVKSELHTSPSVLTAARGGPLPLYLSAAVQQRSSR